jgi:UrcA family protein
MFKLIITAAAFAALVPTIAIAEEAPRQVQISIADLNLSSEAGKAQLNRRIETAVRKVCEAAQPNDIRSSMAAKSCTETARANARNAVQVQIARQTTSTTIATASR